MSGEWDDGSDHGPAHEDAFAAEATITCPWCGVENELAVDPSGGEAQEYVEDCHVCCRPWRVRVTFDALGSPDVDVSIDQ